MEVNENKSEGTRLLEGTANAIRYFFREVGNIKFQTAFKVVSISIMLIILVFVARIAMSKSAVERIVESALITQHEEQARLQIRDMVSPKIQKTLAKMVVTLNCDRAFVIEMHNGKKNATELPFKFFDMTYEEVNDDRQVKNVSQNYIEVLITHFKLPYYLAKHDRFIGTVDELAEIDRRFASNLEEENGSFFAIEILRCGGKDVGFIGVAYNNECEYIPTNKEILDVFSKEGKTIGELLDLSAQEQLLKIGDSDD